VQGKAKLAYYPVLKRKVSWPRLAERVRQTIKNVCPFVVVYIHWGDEKLHYPPKKMKRFSYMLVEAGAQMVIGHHPHVLQGVEFYKGSVIAYSLGNFVFSNPKPECRRTGVLWTELAAGKPSRVTRVELVPAIIHRKDYSPRPATASQTEDLLRRLRAYSRPLGTQVVLSGGRIRFVADRDVQPPGGPEKRP
jgi:poly-gamma-glutamate synthesis protein (capsule biosynthesis protein)